MPRGQGWLMVTPAWSAARAREFSAPIHSKFGADGDGVPDAARDRALIGVEGMRTLHCGQVHVVVDPEVVADVDALEHQDAAVQLDLALGVSPETTASGGDTARFQRAPERAGQSTGRRSDDVVERGGMRRASVRRDTVMLGDLAVHAECDTAGLGRQRRPAQGPFLPLDTHLGPVGNRTYAVAPSLADRQQATPRSDLPSPTAPGEGASLSGNRAGCARWATIAAWRCEPSL